MFTSVCARCSTSNLFLAAVKWRRCPRTLQSQLLLRVYLQNLLTGTITVLILNSVVKFIEAIYCYWKRLKVELVFPDRLGRSITSGWWWPGYPYLACVTLAFLFKQWRKLSWSRREPVQNVVLVSFGSDLGSFGKFVKFGLHSYVSFEILLENDWKDAWIQWCNTRSLQE